MKSIILFLSLVIPSLVHAQKLTRVNKYAFGIEIDLGSSFPHFAFLQDRWKARLYGAGGINFLFENRHNQHWTSDFGIGITGYSLRNQGMEDHYTLDFASPTLSSGIRYGFYDKQQREGFVKLTAGAQLGYKGNFVDEFETYTVFVEGKHQYYPYVRPELGIRRFFKQKMKGSRYRMAYEFGSFFRYNLNSLGKVVIEESDFKLSLEPRGNVIGMYFKLLFPAGRSYMATDRTDEREVRRSMASPRDLK